jgi:hypothetical protein
LEERRLRVFENRVLRRIFGTKRDDVTGEWRKLHNEELHDLYCSPNIFPVIKSRRLRWAGQVACMGKTTDVYRILVRRTEGNRPLGIPRHTWDDTKWIFRKWDVGVWTGLRWLLVETSSGHL